MVLGPAPWPRTSALGDSTRRYSAPRSKRSPLSNATLSVSRAGLSLISLGQILSEGISLFIAQLPRLAGQHHRHAAANGIGQARRPRHQFLFVAVIAQGRLGQGADQDFQQFWVGVHGYPCPAARLSSRRSSLKSVHWTDLTGFAGRSPP